MNMKHLLSLIFAAIFFFSFLPGTSLAQDHEDITADNEAKVTETNDIQAVHLNEDTLQDIEEEQAQSESELHNDEQQIEEDTVENPETDLSETIETEEQGLENTEEEFGLEDTEEELVLGDPNQVSNPENDGDEITALEGIGQEEGLKDSEDIFTDSKEEIIPLEQSMMQLSLLASPMSTVSYSIGNKNNRIKEIKYDLMKAGFGTHWKNPTTYFGKDTENVVKQFQAYYKLPSTGIVDDLFIQKLKSIVTSPYQFGRRSDAVTTLKHDLMKVGFGTHWKNPTTYYGKDTEKIVREFQKSNKLTVNGIVDDITRQKLKDMLENGFGKGMRSPNIKKHKENLQKVGFGTHWKNPTTLFGSDTEKVVLQFQKYYSLSTNGRLDDNTIKKLAQIISSPYQKGKRSNQIQEYKKDLIQVGFGTHWKNPTTLYGLDTEKVVKEFQKANKLVVNGILDEVTLRKLVELKSNSQPKGYNRGMKSEEIQKLKYDLMKVGFGLHWKNPTILFGSDTENVVKEFQRANKLSVNGVIDDATLSKLNELKSQGFVKGMRSEAIRQIKYDLIKAGFGTHWTNPTDYFDSDTENVVKQFQNYFALLVDGEIHIATKNKLNQVVNSPYQKGKRSEEIKELKHHLMAAGFGTHWKNPTTLYGADTEKVVKEFQKANKLVVNGILDEVSLRVLNSKRVVKIFIDPGHGGSDPGAGSNGHQEKTFTLKIAKQIEKYLKQYSNVVIKLSRTNDTTLSLEQRTKMANEWGADYFVSVHINAGGGNGFESFIFERKDNKTGKVVASPTQDEIKKQQIIHDHIANNITERDRGKKRKNFHVLRESHMSAILFEYLFIDNTSERNKLLNDSYIAKLGRLTSEGIAKAFNLSKK